MTTIHQVTDESFQTDVLEAGGVVLVDFWAPWCGPCRQVGPVIEELASEMAGRVTIVKLNTDENPAITERYRITSIPTLLIFSGGEVVSSLIGARPKAAIREALTSHVAA